MCNVLHLHFRPIFAFIKNIHCQKALERKYFCPVSQKALGETVLLPQYPKKYWGLCPQCPYDLVPWSWMSMLRRQYRKPSWLSDLSKFDLHKIVFSACWKVASKGTVPMGTGRYCSVPLKQRLLMPKVTIECAPFSPLSTVSSLES